MASLALPRELREPGRLDVRARRPADAGAVHGALPPTRACIPLPNGDFLDGIGDRGMFRLAYRNFGGHESLVGNQTVSSNGVAGIRWYEIRNATSGIPAFAQQSTFQPDTTNRWLGSAALDASDDLAVGYSVSSSSVAPGLGYAGRLGSDPANALAQGEGALFPGAGSQAGTNNRWGDYSALAVDPVDDCTFWFTGEYYPAGSTQFDWRTRNVSFRFPSCRKGQVLAPPACAVPKVLGLALAKARTRIAGAHCTVGRVARKHAARKQRGKVVGQSPQAGKKLQAGAKVNLTVGT